VVWLLARVSEKVAALIPKFPDQTHCKDAVLGRRAANFGI
jgi:hypothetical protein